MTPYKSGRHFTLSEGEWITFIGCQWRTFIECEWITFIGCQWRTFIGCEWITFIGCQWRTFIECEWITFIGCQWRTFIECEWITFIGCEWMTCYDLYHNSNRVWVIHSHSLDVMNSHSHRVWNVIHFSILVHRMSFTHTLWLKSGKVDDISHSMRVWVNHIQRVWVSFTHTLNHRVWVNDFFISLTLIHSHSFHSHSFTHSEWHSENDSKWQ